MGAWLGEPGYTETMKSGQVVHVTGGGRGIGRACAQAFAAAGASVAVSDLDLAAAQAVAAELGGRSLGFGLDVGDANAVHQAVPRIEAELGPIDVWINNAGLMALGAFLEQDPARDALQLRVNLGGVMNGMRAVLPGMVARGRGHVVNISSVAGRLGTPYAAVYSATKHAVVGLSESVAAELRGTPVRISYVCPGVVSTELVAGIGEVRWPRPIGPEDVARAVVRAVERGTLEVYVPGVAITAKLLPALLPRGVVAWIARVLGADAVFRRPDRAARASYEARALTGGPADLAGGAGGADRADRAGGADRAGVGP